MFRGAILKSSECLQTLLFITLEPPRRSPRPVFGGSAGLFRRVFREASKKFGVECECRRSLQVHLRGPGGPMGALRVDLDALKGPAHGPSVRFFASFYRSWGIPESFLEGSGPTK